jgi:hypothetical protein
MPSTTVTLDTPFGASGYQRTSRDAEMDYKHAQPSNIQDVANPGEMSTGVVHPLATATGSVEHSQPVAPTGSGGGATIVNHNMTTLQESGGQADTEMTQGLDGGVHRVSTISLVGKGVDGEDQTATGELAWGKEPPTASTEMEVKIPDGKRSPGISPAQKGPIQSLMVTPRISWHIPINEAHLAFIKSNSDAIKGIKNTHPCSRGNGETFVSIKERLDHIRTPIFARRCYQCSFLQLKLEDKYWVTHSLMGLAWHLRALPGDNCVFCTRILKLMSSLCLTLPNVYALTYTSISAERSTSHAGVVRQSLAPGLMPRRDLEQ